MALNVSTLNINGLNDDKKEMKLISLANYYKLDIIMLQEHNIKAGNSLNYVKQYFEVFMNYTTCLKGGVAILISKRLLPITILNQEMDYEGRVLSLKIKLGEKILQLLNVYAPSGSSKRRERDMFFDNLLYYLRHNVDNIIFAGDFNCITHVKDVSTMDKTAISKKLGDLVKGIGLKDAANHNLVTEYTYIRTNYASRIDRMYVKSLFNHINSCNTVPVAFSDHCMVIISVNLLKTKTGKGMWKLNVSILNRNDVKENFIVLWQFLKGQQKKFNDMLTWWIYCKEKLKAFFVKMSKKILAEKYGLMNLLQCRLKELYQKANVGIIDFDVINSLKNKIEKMQNEVCEGVKIRTRIKDKLEGEKISLHLLRKEKKNRNTELMQNINGQNGQVLNNTEAILIHAKDLYENLYNKVEGDNCLQDVLLELCYGKLDDEDCNYLTGNVTKLELANVIKGLSTGKVPGLDGLPSEFYKEFWEIIKDDFFEVVRHILDKQELCALQNEGMIKLLNKGNDDQTLNGWRPISLLNVDYKIISKLLANRLKTIMHKLISEEQFCSVKGRSIVNCNNNIRDIIYYTYENNYAMAVLKLDWNKAFDGVHHDFLFNIMKKLGIPDLFIKWIKILYDNCRSRLCINGMLSDAFPILRSVRQGCPLSMLLYVIYQEPLYLSIKNNKSIVPPQLPNGWKICIQGYADDSSVFVSTEQSIVEVFKEISLFENASGALLNRDKSSITGVGKWHGKNDWPFDWLKIEHNLKILGIFHYENERKTIEMNWNIVIKKLEKTINAFLNRCLTIFQKAIIINSLLLSKVWYVAHTLPLNKIFAQKIIFLIFRYLWKSNYHPIRRTTLFLPKSEGGLGIIDVFDKAAAILTATSLKESVEGRQLNLYYCRMRLSYLLETEYYQELSYISPMFYSGVVENIRKIHKHAKFPRIKSKEIYSALRTKSPPLVEEDYPLLHWKRIWGNVNNPIVGIREREFMFKYLHERLPTNKRLELLGIRNNGNCELCNEPEYTMHIFYFCKGIKSSFNWFKRKLKLMCKLEDSNWFELLMLDIKGKSKRDQNTAALLICNYLYCVWISHTQKFSEGETVSLIKGKIYYLRWFLNVVYETKMNEYVTKEFSSVIL